MKRRPLPKHPQLVEIDWIDSENYHGGQWCGIDEVREHYREHGPDTIRSLGYLIDQTEAYVLIAGCLQFDHDWKIPRGARFHAIPRGCVRKIRRLK